MQARYYAPVIGRFYSNDPVGYTGEVDTFNRYSYVANNPYKYTDPTGMSKKEERERKRYDSCQKDANCQNMIPYRNYGETDSSGESGGAGNHNTGYAYTIDDKPLVNVCPLCYLVGGKAIWEVFTFKGAGWFGEKGLTIGKVRVDAMYANPRAGLGAGTAFSLKGPYSRFRLDYGVLHSTGRMGWHSTIRFKLGKFYQFGSTAQRTWHPPWRIITKNEY